MSPRSQAIVTGLVLVAVVIVIIVFRSRPNPPPTPPQTSLQPVPVEASEVAKGIVAGFGKVSDSAIGQNYGNVVVFEEKHDSHIGQIEIAAMLYRLYATHNLRQIALEGATKPVQASWFHSLPDRATRRDVGIRLVQEGEISSAEFMALVSPDVSVHGVEKQEEYSVDASAEAQEAPVAYLLAIAEKTLAPNQLQEVENLLQQDRGKDAWDLIINSDLWIQKVIKRLNSAHISIEDEIHVLNEIEKKASEVGASLPESISSAFRELQHFYEIASQRSDTMVANTLTLARENPNTVVALTLGAGHTRKVSRLLNDASVSFAIVTPNSLARNDASPSLSKEAFNRKQNGVSVDGPGSLGAILSTPRKPPPVLDHDWLQAKAETYYLTIVRARAAAAGGPGGPPDLPEHEGFHAHGPPDCYDAKEPEIVFCVFALNRELWVRAAELSPRIAAQSTLSALKKAREAARRESDGTATDIQRLELSPGVAAIFSSDEMTVRNAKLTDGN